MASTVIGPIKLHEQQGDELCESLIRWIPNLTKVADQSAGNLVSDIETIIKHELWKHLGFDSFNDYSEAHLKHSAEWCHEFVRIFRKDWNRHKGNMTVGQVEEAISQKQREIAERVEKSKALVNDGMTQREAAEVLGVNHDTIAKDCKRNIVITEKILQKPKRKVDGYRITQYTKPTTAAEKIIGKFGVEFSMDLADAILKEMHG